MPDISLHHNSMRPVRKLSPGIEVFEVPGGKRIVISTKPHWEELIVYGIFLVFWFIGEKFAFRELISLPFSDEELKWFIFLFFAGWFTGWTVAGIFFGWRILWSLFGKEIVTITNSSLRIMRGLSGRGREKEFPLQEIFHIHAAVSADPEARLLRQSFNALKWVGEICFYRHFQIQTFGIGLGPDEAVKLVEELKEHLPSRCFELPSRQSVTESFHLFHPGTGHGMKPVSIRPLKDGLQVSFLSIGNYFISVFLSGVLIAISVAFIMFGFMMMKRPDLFSQLVLIGVWILLGGLSLLLFYCVVGLFLSRQVIRIDGQSFRMKEGILGKGKEKIIPLSEVKNLRYINRLKRSYIMRSDTGLKLKGNGNIGFDYEGKTRLFGVNVPELTGRELATMMNLFLICE